MEFARIYDLTTLIPELININTAVKIIQLNRHYGRDLTEFIDLLAHEVIYL